MTTSQPQPAHRPTGQLPVSAASGEGFDDDFRVNLPLTRARGVTVTWWYTFVSVLALALAMLGISALVLGVMMQEAEASMGLLVVSLALCLGTIPAVVYASWLMRENYGTGWTPWPATLAMFSVPVVCWAVTVALPGAAFYGALPLWILISVLLPLLRLRQRLVVFLVGTVLVLGHGWLNPDTSMVLGPGQPFTTVVILLVLLPPSIVFSAWWWRVVVDLDAARTASGQLAVARERLRFASDLHDIQGHHLQVIALQAELADRMLSSSYPHAQTAAQEAIREVRALAEQAQQETRQLVRDLRVVSLREELDNARDVLEAAGIATTIDVETGPGTVSEQHDRLMGLAVREATTNILRHSSAAEVSLRWSVDDVQRLEIINDGVEPGGAENSSGQQGTGLAGLDTRFREAGGSVTHERDGSRFRLIAAVPLP